MNQKLPEVGLMNTKKSSSNTYKKPHSDQKRSVAALEESKIISAKEKQ